MKKLIINADDFGASHEVNNAIMALMDLNLCTDTTLLVNSEAVEEAVNLAIKSKRKNDVGIHLNLTSGLPVSDGIKAESRFCDSEGSFHFKRTKRIFFLSKSEKKAVYNELTAQIKLCRKLGIPISHADTHHHFHEEPGLFKIVMDVLRREKISNLRKLAHIRNSPLLNSVYRKAGNYILTKKNLSDVNYFINLEDFTTSKMKTVPGMIVEVMIHPGLIKEDQVFDTYSLENLTEELPKIIEGNLLISYDQLS